MRLLPFLSVFGTNKGGSGGRGGDVILECSPTVWDFSGLQHHIVCNSTFVIVWQNISLVINEKIDRNGLLQTAKRGGPGASKNMIGTRGEDKVLFQICFYSKFVYLKISSQWMSLAT